MLLAFLHLRISLSSSLKEIFAEYGIPDQQFFTFSPWEMFCHFLHGFHISTEKVMDIWVGVHLQMMHHSSLWLISNILHCLCFQQFNIDMSGGEFEFMFQVHPASQVCFLPNLDNFQPFFFPFFFFFQHHTILSASGCSITWMLDLLLLTQSSLRPCSFLDFFFLLIR